MNKINLKVYFKKRKQRLSILGISPRFDWLFILAFATIIFFAGLGYAIYLYVNINNNSLFETLDVDGGNQEIEQQKIEIKNTIELLEKRNFDESVLN